MDFSASQFLDFSHSLHEAAFPKDAPVWAVLPRIAPYLASELRPKNEATMRGQSYIQGNVRIGKGTIISHGVTILGPVWIGENCYIGPGCYLRENTILGDGVIVGNSCELKNCIIFDKAEIPHWNYVGDSVMGFKSHIGASVILSNYRLDHGKVPVLDPENPGRRIETGLDKFGAIIGDEVDIGSNAVISPGSIIGRGSLLYPLTHWCGVLPEKSILKLRQTTQVVKKRF
jgi:UDP-N-acetylglucosamine diphosphorylase / glucose-1-phosphate thymidylyltransferase / UDP-N-acetylgalactosamine diphosphorylase / glucosamine-1-phosphate N-acetyltransferase / galactosamine-1-phosphate N-acetyltransferase